MRSRPFRLLAAVLAVLVAATACQTAQNGGFEDHTVSKITSIDDFDRLARSEGVQSAVKFAIPDLSAPGVVWLDSRFYNFHDEWYWFRLINGEPVPGLDTAPVNIGPANGFQTIDDVYAWASTHRDELPLDLTFAADGERLYSNRYYDLALRDVDKTYGLGTLVRFDTDNGARWVIEMEFNEATTVESVDRFFNRLEETLPPEIGENLEWVARSPDQAATADELVEGGNARSDQIVRYAELVPQGDVAVYNPGLTAGRLRLIKGADDLNRAKPGDILVMENVPDWLPPATAILTSNPQTPLAHVNLLARNRGIPNVSVSGLLDDPAISIAARSRSHAVVRASASGELRVTLISKDQFDAWNALREPSEIAVPLIDLASTPTIYSLAELALTIESEADVAVLRPTIGGKSAGFLALLAADGVATPDSPIAVTVAPYFRHLAMVDAELEAMLANREFQREPRIRFLLLEGGEEYAELFTNVLDAEFAAEFVEDHRDGPIGAILEADGFMNIFRDVDMAGDDLDEITRALEETFAPLSKLQGLRFRSSSSVEDIEGFTGAGLYDSNTGFLNPLLQADESDHKKTVERTIKKTWASYWSFEAFEERRLENVEHRTGGMGVLVHPRFDDALEVDNGVATLVLLPAGSSARAVLTINVQVGDVSVTNPDAGTKVLPEEILVHVSDDNTLTIERTSQSTLAPAEAVVMDDDAVLELLDQLQAVATLWRDRVNRDLKADQQVEIVTLDFEFKHMAAGWPAMASGEGRPARLVVKQARSLDPGLRGVSDQVLALPIPRDVLARAILVQQVVCLDGAEGIEVTTSSSTGVDGLGSFARMLRFSDVPEALDADGCARTVLLSSPEQFLMELLESGEGLALS